VCETCGYDRKSENIGKTHSFQFRKKWEKKIAPSPFSARTGSIEFYKYTHGIPLDCFPRLELSNTY
jgi:hypothetical protein